jgi:hypothetical protein
MLPDAPDDVDPVRASADEAIEWGCRLKEWAELNKQG